MKNLLLRVNTGIQIKKTFKEKSYIVLNVLAALALAIFFGYIMSVSCGAYYIVEILACLLFIALNIWYLSKTQPYSEGQVIALIAGILAVLIVGIAYMIIVMKQTMCDYFWCLDSSTSNLTIISDYKSDFDDCGLDPSVISQRILLYTYNSYDEDVTEIEGYYWSTYFSFELILIIMSITFLLEVFILSYLRKKQQEKLGLLLGQQNNS